MTQPSLASAAVGFGRLIRGLLALTGLGVLVVGAPWALWHFIGWPLPDHVPDAAELRIAFNSGLTGDLLLNLLAIACWVAWAAFVIDLLRCLPAVLAYAGERAHQLPAGSGPVYGLAALLLSTGILPLLGARTSSGSTAAASAPTIVATTTYAGASVESAKPPATPPGSPAKPKPTSRTPNTVVVREPRNGIHDSLWRIAQRELGNGAKWPQLYRLNKQRPQPDGGRLTNPHLIYPGWVLRLPEPSAPPAQERSERTESSDSSSKRPERQPPHKPTGKQTNHPTPHLTQDERSPQATQSSPQSSAQPSRQTSDTAVRGQASDRPSQRETEPGDGAAGIDTETGAFVGLGVAAAISAALVAVRLRRRRWYQPGSGRRDDLHTPPIVRALRREHLRAITAASGVEATPGDSPPLNSDGDNGTSGNGQDSPTATRVTLGVREGHELVLDVATARGVGLIGPGAQDAARALLLTLLATRGKATNQPEVLITQPLLDTLLDEPAAHDQGASGLSVVGDVDAALDRVEAEIVRRTRLAGEAGAAAETDNDEGLVSRSRLVIVAAPPAGSSRRLQAVLDNGSTVGVVGVLVGQWRPGGTVYVDADGTVVHTNPGWAEALRHARLFTLPASDANELLALLHEAEADQITGDMPTGPEPNVTTSQTKDGRPGGPTDGSDDAADADVYVLADTGTGTESGAEGPQPSEAEVTYPEPVASRSPDTVDGVDGMSSTGKETDAGTDTPSTVRLPRQPRGADDHTWHEAATPVPLLLNVLGPPRLRWEGPGGLVDIGHRLSPRQREVLVFLALHPRGVHRDVLLATLWPDSPRRRPTNALHTALSKLRHTLGAATTTALGELIVLRENQYQLDPGCFAVDFWVFTQATAEGRAATDDASRESAYQCAVVAYSGELGQGLSTEWIEAPREAARREAVDAASRLSRIVQGSDAHRALELLELVRAFDPHNETVYRDIMRIQAQLGHPDAVARTLSLLATRLGELGLRPDEATLRLATSLQQPSPNTEA